MAGAILRELRAALAEVRDLRNRVAKELGYSSYFHLQVADYGMPVAEMMSLMDKTLGDLEPLYSILHRFAIHHADLSIEAFDGPVGVERVREWWDYHYGALAPRTRGKVLSVLRDFFDWAQRERRGPDGRPVLLENPAKQLRAPKQRQVRREPFSESFVRDMIAAQPYLPDRLGAAAARGVRVAGRAHAPVFPAW